MNDSTRDVLLARIDENVKALVTNQGDHEVRLRGLESTSHTQRGAMTIVATICSGVWALILVIAGYVWSR